MSRHEERVELFRALEVSEVEARAQHTDLATASSYCGPYES